MADVTVYHNRTCSTSRKTLELLAAEGIDVDVVEYLKTPLSRDELVALLAILEDPPADLVRKDGFFKDQGLDAGDYETPDAVADLLVLHPRLMQRPVVVRGGRTLVARPIERALDVAR